MSATVTVIDYGMGNLLSVSRAFERCGARVEITDDADRIASARRLVLPGVGAFKDGMSGLRDRGLIDEIRNYAASGRPLLGICLGMQMLLEVSEEFGTHEGLGLIPGRIVAIPATAANGAAHKIPHIGWNELAYAAEVRDWQGTILEELPPGASVYFVHSFTAQPANAECRLADCDYNGRLVSAAIRSGSIYGCQFHPEKSGDTGLRIISKFLLLA